MIEHWSNSKVNMIARCPRQFWYRYINGLVMPPNAALTFGQSYHTTLEENFRFRLEVGQDMPLKMVKNIFADEWEHNTDVIDWEFETVDKGWLKDIGVGLVGKYVEEIAPNRNPIVIEERLEASIDGVERPFIGIVDFIDEKGFVFDHKTAARRWNQNRANTELQATGYYLLYQSSYGKKPLGFVYDIGIKTTKMQIQTLTTVRDEPALNDYIERLRVAESLVTKEVYPKTDPGNWMCSKRWCGYYLHCMGGASLTRLNLVEEGDSLADAI